MDGAAAVRFLESRVLDLERALEEQRWVRLDWLGGREFSRSALDRIVDAARAAYLKNPLVRRAVETSALYVWGQDLSVTVGDDEVREVVDRFWTDNHRALTGQQASRLLEVELEVSGNLFLLLFSDPVSGRVLVRHVPVEEVRAIVANPDDRTEPWYYRREWAQVTSDGVSSPVVAYYPDHRHRPTVRPAEVNGVTVRWDAAVYHVRVGSFPHWQWGVPEVYAALDWATAYTRLLEDDATRSRALARFAWLLTVPGGSGAMEATRRRLETTLGLAGDAPENPPPVAGSVLLSTAGASMEPVRLAGATLPADHARPVRLMVAAALGLPETFFGDVDVGNLATARTLDRPTELRFSERRQLWRDVYRDLLAYAVDADVAATNGLLAGRVLLPEDRVIDVAWPDLLERSVTERVAAIVSAATLNGHPPAGTVAPETLSRLLLVALGVEDVDAELDRLAAEVPADR